MSWWKAANMTVTANSKFITVLSGDSWELLSPTDGLVAGNNAPVEIKRAYFDGNNTIIELVNPWPNSTSNNLTGVAFPTDADLGEISKALSNYLESFTLATGTDATTGTENTRPMTALRVREAMNNRLGNIGLNFKVTRVGFNSYTTPEALVTLFGDPVEYSSALIQFEVPEMYGFVRGFAQSTDSYNYSFQEFTGASNKKYFRTATGATTWTPWREFLLTGDYGFGTRFIGVQPVNGTQTPAQITTGFGDDINYIGKVEFHGGSAPDTYGVLSGFHTSGNNYSYSNQEFTTIYGVKYHRTAAGANGWNPWRKVLVEGDFGLGAVSSPSGVANDTGLNSIISVGAAWANSPYAGTDSRNQGMILTMKHADPAYGIQMFHGLSTRDSYFRNYSAGSFNSWDKVVFKSEIGNFGQSTLGVNLDDSLANGVYRQEIPSGIAINYSACLNMHSNDGRSQLIIDRCGSRAAFRGSTNAVAGAENWFPWKELYHTGNVIGSMKGVLWDTAGACPIIERGSNSNGNWTAFADGTIFAWGTVTMTGLSLNPAFNNNSNTGVILQPIMPTPVSGTVSITKAACYTATDNLVYSALWAGAGGSTMLINTGQRPTDQWPRLDQAGGYVGTKVVYEWAAVGRWK